MGWMLDRVGRAVARYLERPAPGYEPFTPSDRAEPGRPRQGLRLRDRAHRPRLRFKEHYRPDALPDAAAGAAALAAAHDGARLGRSHAADLLGPDRAGVRGRALSDPAESDAHRKPRGPARHSRNPPFLPVRA